MRRLHFCTFTIETCEKNTYGLLWLWRGQKKNKAYDSNNDMRKYGSVPLLISRGCYRIPSIILSIVHRRLFGELLELTEKRPKDGHSHWNLHSWTFFWTCCLSTLGPCTRVHEPGCSSATCTVHACALLQQLFRHRALGILLVFCFFFLMKQQVAGECQRFNTQPLLKPHGSLLSPSVNYPSVGLLNEVLLMLNSSSWWAMMSFLGLEM